MIAQLNITTGVRNNRTYLQSAYYTTPLKVIDVTENKKEGILILMLMSSSPGVLDGDEYAINIDVGADCKLQIETQSFQRLFTMRGAATQTFTVQIKAGASFQYLPHPTVPHAGSNFLSKNIIHLAAGSSLLWGEVLSCGRQTSNEVFAYRRLQIITEIFIEKQLIVKENLNIEPSLFNPLHMGHYEGFTHQATLIFVSDKLSIKELTTTVQQYLATVENIDFGLSSLNANGIIIKMLGTKAEHLYHVQKKLAGLCNAPATTIDNILKAQVYGI